MRRELYRVWIISHCCSKVSHKPTSRCFVLITMQVEAFLSAQRANRVFRSCFVHMFQTTTLGTGTFVVVWWLEDELMVVGRGYAALGGGSEGGERIAREWHGPAQPAACGNGAGQWHDAPGHTGGKTQLFAFHHIEGAVKRHDNLAFVIRGIAERGLAVRLAIRSRRCLFLGRMSTAATAAGARLGPIASARFPSIGANIM